MLSAPSFNQAMDELKSANQVSQQVLALVQRLASADRAITTEQTSIRRDAAQAAAHGRPARRAERSAAAAAREPQHGVRGLSGPARQLAAEIANIDNQIALLEAGPHVGSGRAATTSRTGSARTTSRRARCVPWLGNAKDWYSAAAAMGYKEGRVPVAGAIVVFRPGVSGVSWLGHVAYVEAVGPAQGIPAGSFKLSEMNYAGWNRVDYRVDRRQRRLDHGVHLRELAASIACLSSSWAAGRASTRSEARAPARPRRACTIRPAWAWTVTPATAASRGGKTLREHRADESGEHVAGAPGRQRHDAMVIHMGGVRRWQPRRSPAPLSTTTAVCACA